MDPEMCLESLADSQGCKASGGGGGGWKGALLVSRVGAKTYVITNAVVTQTRNQGSHVVSTCGCAQMFTGHKSRQTGREPAKVDTRANSHRHTYVSCSRQKGQ